MAISRRRFLGMASAAGVGLVSGALEAAAPVAGAGQRAADAEAGCYVDRLAFAPWMNDVRMEPLPFSGWPPEAFDDVTVSSLTQTFALNEEFGYNYFDIYGLFATWGWPLRLEDAATPDRVRRVRQVLKAAHDHNLKVVYGLGVYSWGFDEIIKADPAVRGPNPHAMCASKEESWRWQQRLIDFILRYDVDGFHLESADLGRCTCDECRGRWPVDADYHNYVTSRTARYIRRVQPGAYICVTLISWADWNTGLTEEARNALVELSRSVDCIFDQGHHSTYIRPPERKAFIQRLHCRYGTSGGLWVYPTYVWDRLQWFLPYPRQTGTHMRDLYADGGRGVMYYQGPPNNPSSEINVAFGGEFMNHPDRSVEENLATVLRKLYRPKSPAALERLVKLVRSAEDAYFNHMDWDEEHRYLRGNKELPNLFGDFPGPGEFHLSRPLTGLLGTPDYLLEPHLTAEGRKAYNSDLEVCLKEAYAIGDHFGDQQRMRRLQTAILNTLVMVRTIISAAQWQQEQEKARQRKS